MIDKHNDQDVRRERLKKWIESNFDGIQARFVSQHDLNQGEISTLLNGKRTFGEKKARLLEKIAGMPYKWLDAPLNKPWPIATTVVAYNENDPLQDDEVEVPQYFYKLNEGTGKLMWEIDHSGKTNRFIKDWCLIKNVEATNLVVLPIDGDSMFPTIPVGAKITIDKGNTSIRNGKIHAIDYLGEFFIQRLFRLPDGSVIVRSDNPDKVRHPDWTVTSETPDVLNIMGAVISMQADID